MTRTEKKIFALSKDVSLSKTAIIFGHRELRVNFLENAADRRIISFHILL